MLDIAGGEAPQGFGAHLFGAVERHPPRSEVETGEVGVVDLGRAQLIGEIGTGRPRPAITVDCLQPTRRTREKREGRHQYQRHSVLQTAEAGADQAHVVKVWQTAYKFVMFG